MAEILGVYKVDNRIPLPHRISFEAQIDSWSPDVRSVAESLALRNMDSAKRYVSQYLSANRGGGRS